jgi:CheY-like chemotaxis protein
MKVLVVDDNRDAALTLSTFMSVLGHQSRTAYDGREALDIADEFVPDVVLLDLGLPVMDGLEACRQIRQRPWGARVTVIAITGSGGTDDRRKTQAAGFNDHLVKPVAPALLLHMLAEVERRW